MDSNDPTVLKQAFEAMDKDGSGQIGAVELQSGLSNGTDNKPFNIKTCRLMVAMFDKNQSHTINFDEFCQLWTFVNMWVKTFENFDENNSGKIDKLELNKLLSTIGYRFSDKFYSFIIKKFGSSSDGQIVFDDFLLICLMLHMLTGVFSSMDTRRTGEIDLSYDKFVETVFDVNTY